MRMFDPESPTTEALHQEFPVDEQMFFNIQEARLRLGSIMCGERSGLIVILGPCAMTDTEDIIDSEGDQITKLGLEEDNVETLHRLCDWKPRSDPAELYWGRETVDPRGAYATTHRRARQAANVEKEVGHPLHLERTGALITMGRIGARALNDIALVEALALTDPALPIGVKNGTDGELGLALDRLRKIRELRGDSGAPAILVYRGGDNARTPEEWEKQYIRAHDLTDGELIVDIAHGTEMAHHLNGQYKKSGSGQVAALGHVIDLAEQGYMPRGIMAEASDAISPTDPHMSFHVAVGGVRRLNHIRKATLVGVA